MTESADTRLAHYVIAVASGKGGVGKSTVAVNLAAVLAQEGAAVALLDADIYGPNIPTMMGVEGSVHQKDGKLIPIVAHGIKIMSIGFLVESGQPLIWRGPMLHSTIKQFITMVDWGDLDYMIIDLPPGTGDAQLSITQTAALTGGIIVTLPQKVSQEDALRGLEMFRSVNVPVLGVVENMSYLEMPDGSQVDVFGHGGGQELARDAQVAFMGEIPMNPSVRISGDTGTPEIIANPDSTVSQAIRSITAKMKQTLQAMDVSASDEVTIEELD